MAQFDIYRGLETADLVVELQSAALDHLNTRLVAPLILADSFGDPVMRLNPRVIVDGQAYLLLTQYVAAVPTNELRQFVGNLRPDQDHIKLALDLIFYGF